MSGDEHGDEQDEQRVDAELASIKVCAAHNAAECVSHATQMAAGRKGGSMNSINPIWANQAIPPPRQKTFGANVMRVTEAQEME